jgi:hypothetical protein
VSFEKAATVSTAGYVFGGAIVTVVCAFYPAVCGYFPVYWMRWELALPVAAIQFLFLAIVVAISAWLERTFGASAN